MIDVRKTMYNFHEFNMFLLKIQQNNMVVVPSTHIEGQLLLILIDLSF